MIQLSFLMALYGWGRITKMLVVTLKPPRDEVENGKALKLVSRNSSSHFLLPVGRDRASNTRRPKIL